ncbi:hypothetical protein GCM10009550_52890 [Actinocorallia libanotica]|uniref:Uncharacterized protein n=1 Tax=Actinocorallia libanotica TaxID=46162 RepID=A0ABN1RP73_9ACTN
MDRGADEGEDRHHEDLHLRSRLSLSGDDHLTFRDVGAGGQGSALRAIALEADGLREIRLGPVSDDPEGLPAATARKAGPVAALPHWR